MLLERLLAKLIRHGRLTVVGHDGTTRTYGALPGPEVTIRLHAPHVGRRMALNLSLGTAEAYMDGLLTIEDGELYDLLELAGLNLEREEKPTIVKLREALAVLGRRLMQRNPIPRARRNAAHHYDLSDDLYELFLDSNRQYSCAYFLGPDDDLETAQVNKMRHIASKLLLTPGQSVLDIGSGWGGLGLYLARQAGVEVRGVTLSREQHKASEQRAERAGLAARVRFELKDYRLADGRYDRIVSVGMFEHVGVGHYREFFAKLRELLAPDGVALLHTIGRADKPGSSDAFVRKYIFPGGYVPALSEVVAAVERAGLVITDVEVLRLHYADTLRAWRKRFLANRDKAKALYDERFCRMWEFYLAGSEVSFRHLGLVVFQIQLARRQDAVPLVRDYVSESDRRAADSDIAAE
jgi:cyclopropane-fatty-acyl-phospholipid synthase